MGLWRHSHQSAGAVCIPVRVKQIGTISSVSKIQPQEVVDNVRQEEYMKNLLWVDDSDNENNEIVDNDVLSVAGAGY